MISLPEHRPDATRSAADRSSPTRFPEAGSSAAGLPVAGSSAVRSHFALFGLPEQFAVAPAELEARFRRVQAAVHPDRHAAGSETDRRLAMQLAADVNEAYRTLSDPTRRGAYLCERHGAPVEAERNTAMPAEFLMRQMEWREAIDEVRDQPAHEAAELAARLSVDRDAAIDRLAGLIDGQGDYRAAADVVRELMFYDRLQTEIRQIQLRAG